MRRSIFLFLEVLFRIVLLFLYWWTDDHEPFIRVIQKEEWWLYKNPHTPASLVTVTTPMLFWIVIFVPTVLFVVYGVVFKSGRDTISALLGLSMSLLLNGIITNGIKLMVARPRPDFFERCFPDLTENFHGLTPLCTGEHDVIMEGRKSFPSGHSSWSFAGMLFVSLYISGKLKLLSSTPRSLIKFAVSLSPLLVALFIALSRYCDYWHHYEDVTVGSIIGSMLAFTSYFYYYPSLSHPLCDVSRDLIADTEKPAKSSSYLPRTASLDRLQMVKVM